MVDDLKTNARKEAELVVPRRGSGARNSKAGPVRGFPVQDDIYRLRRQRKELRRP
jgi:hypothetical protein